MTIHLEIPVWLLWCIGVPLGLIVVLLAVFGVWCLFAFSKWTMF